MNPQEPSGRPAWLERTPEGWSVRLPLRREAITFEKRTIVGERLTVRRVRVTDSQHVETELKRERVLVERVTTEPTEERLPHHDTLAATGMDQDPLG